MNLLRVVLKVRGHDVVPPPPSNLLAVFTKVTLTTEDSGEEPTVPAQSAVTRETS